MQVAEKALTYFQGAVELAPYQPRWRLLMAACLRRIGQFHKALTEYEDIHQHFPDNIECLKFLVKLCCDMGLKEAQGYTIELRKLEKAHENRERHGSAGLGTTSSKSSRTSFRSGSGLSLLEQQESPLKEDNLHSRDMHTDYKIVKADSTEFVIDFNSQNPVGPLPIRPMTATGKRDDEFDNEELGADLLPE
ncbi:intraflagellar transport protein 88 homolog isoform X2 [Copidosoma floridanum]|uniref:intraflagellar transport protein 88 homolog isoform X2 n=1 Tax=Copidosoma floridanum TaxID=29053 RepID=UPI0006C9E33B|nr:intraflagellar transport protein 88 homolog isoform X2 [Copidosoma floridanum]